MEGIVIVGVFLLLLLLRIPIAYALGMSTLVTILCFDSLERAVSGADHVHLLRLFLASGGALFHYFRRCHGCDGYFRKADWIR